MNHPLQPIFKIVLGLLALCLAFDQQVFDILAAPDNRESDIHRLFRILGYAGTWAIITLALWRGFDRTQPDKARFLLKSLFLSSVIAATTKLLVRRLRPEASEETWGFRPYIERSWDGGGLSFPSEHTALAFAGLMSLAIFSPRHRLLLFAVAAGCGWSRIYAGDHFPSDVAAGALVGIVSVWITNATKPDVRS